MFTKFDRDGNGTISFDEFLQNLRVSQVNTFTNFKQGR